MKSFFKTLVLGAAAVLFASCAGTEAAPPKPAAKVVAGSRFEAAGKVRLHPGMPCAPPIMFDFQVATPRRLLSLAARMADSKVLTEAARRHRSVRIWGTWKRGLDRDCYYVSVTKIEMVKQGWSFPGFRH